VRLGTRRIENTRHEASNKTVVCRLPEMHERHANALLQVLNISGPVAQSALFRQIRFNLFPQWADAVVIMAQTNPRVCKHRLQHKWPGKINGDQESYLSTLSGNRKMDLVGTHKVISEGRARVWSRVMTATCCSGAASAWKNGLCVTSIRVKILCRNNIAWRFYMRY
jgi:hypothetical protein